MPGCEHEALRHSSQVPKAASDRQAASSNRTGRTPRRKRMARSPETIRKAVSTATVSSIRSWTITASTKAETLADPRAAANTNPALRCSRLPLCDSIATGPVSRAVPPPSTCKPSRQSKQDIEARSILTVTRLTVRLPWSSPNLSTPR